MDPQTFDRVPKPSFGFYRDTLKANKTVGSVAKLQPSGDFN
jgi:hypothetical protein